MNTIPAYETTIALSDSANRWRHWSQEEDAPLPLPWWVGKDDVLRHSYDPYRAAILRDSHKPAEEMGHSVAIVRTYYDAVVSPSVATLNAYLAGLVDFVFSHISWRQILCRRRFLA